MDTLADDKIIKIAKDVANATLLSSNVVDVLAAPTLDSTGAEAIEITIVLNPGSLAAIAGPRSAPRSPKPCENWRTPARSAFRSCASPPKTISKMPPPDPEHPVTPSQ
jgi:hypothetical protein